jgi:hypothetical protein
MELASIPSTTVYEYVVTAFAFVLDHFRSFSRDLMVIHKGNILTAVIALLLEADEQKLVIHADNSSSDTAE